MKIEDYGMIGDMHTAALVGLNGSIDWLCMPRYDGNACFAALLGGEENGFWRLAPAVPVKRVTQAYRDSTLILETTFETDQGTVRLVDCMPVKGRYHDVLRVVEGVSGRVPMAMKLVARFDYGRTIPWVRRDNNGITAIAGPNALALRSRVATHGVGLATQAEFEIAAGEHETFMLTWYRSHEVAPEPVDHLRVLEGTELFWREWSSRCTYAGEWREAVVRSLLTLKALTYAPTGGIVAAPTTSLPEHIGGVRNWDYRYCWLRDATLTLHSLMNAGYTAEAAAWSDWLLRAVAGDPRQMQIMYGVGGERTLTELELPHLSGYENSRPVRVGNAAAEQFQLDVYGEVMAAMHLARTLGIRPGASAWHLQRHLVEFVVEHWQDPDEGIWEVRGPRQHFTHSKVMAWVALDRAVKSVEEYDLPGDLERWRVIRKQIHDDVCTRGYDPVRKAFTQAYGTAKLDASLLMIPLVGFLPATDERVRNTVNAIMEELLVNGLVLRYRTETTDDGLPPGEGTFLPCSFWLADCLHLMGRGEEARALFERLLQLRNQLGLLAEEYEPRSARQLGNYPQAFSHVELINTAFILSRPAGRSAVPLTSAGNT